ncbi:MAG: DUF4386 domain-containing protein [Bacteroidota bacterium]
MVKKNGNPSIRNLSRVAGLLGLLVLICGSLTHSFNTEIIHLSDPSTTANNFSTMASKYRIGFVSGLLMETIFVFYACLLYYLLRPVHKDLAKLMLVLALLPAPIFFINQLNHFAAFLAANQDMAQMMFYLKLHKHGGFIISIFFGLWLFPLGLLVYQSTFLPKILGILLMIGCFGYLISFVQGFLWPDYQATLWTNPVLVVTHIAEILLMLWLLILGINQEKYNQSR